MQHGRRTALSILISAAGVAVYVAALLTGLGGERVAVGISDVGLVAGAGVAAIACGVASRRHEGQSRLCWTLMAAAAGAWALGEAIWSFYEVVALREVPFPSLADGAYLAAIPLAAAAMLTFPSAPVGRTSRTRAILDGMVIFSSMLIVSWVTVLGPLVRANSGGLLEQTISIAYPAGDVVILTTVFYVIARAKRPARGPLLFIGLGLAAIAVSDTGYTYLTLKSTYSSGHLIDAGWLVGYLLIAIASSLSAPTEEPDAREERFTRIGAAVPYTAVLGAVLVLGIEQTSHGKLDLVAFWAAAALVLLVVSRQFLTRLDNVALSQTLEDRVASRTAELARTLEELNDAKRKEEAFVASTSHELRTPVTTIIGASKTLLHHGFGLDEQGRELLDMVHRAGERMAGLVEELLAVAGVPFESTVLSSVVQIADVVASVTETLETAGQRLEIRVPRSLVALGDVTYLRQIIAHLLSNAAAFSPPGTTIFIEGYGGTGNVNLVVRDEGPGIPIELREQVFEPFYQVDGTSTREHGGVGLGLFLVKNLAERMGGKIVLQHPSGKGAAFVLTLPTEGDVGPTRAVQSLEPRVVAPTSSGAGSLRPR